MRMHRFKYFFLILIITMVEPNFEDRVRNSFIKVKEDMIKIELEIREYKELIKLQNEQIELLLRKLEEISLENKNKAQLPIVSDTVSIGNEGVYAHMRAHMRAHMHITPGEKEENLLKEPILDSLSDIDKMFLSLTKKEFLIFLTIYQLEDDLGKVTYDDLSSHFKLTPGCIRTHIANMVKKNIPIIRAKINNKLTLFSISDDFRHLNIKSRLFNLYNNQDPYQKKLI